MSLRERIRPGLGIVDGSSRIIGLSYSWRCFRRR